MLYFGYSGLTDKISLVFSGEPFILLMIMTVDTLDVKIKHLFNKFVDAFICVCVLSTFSRVVTAEPSADAVPSTFTEWCLQYETLAEATQWSIDYLLSNARTEECAEAKQKLQNESELQGWINSQADFRPFMTLPEVVELKFRTTVGEGMDVDFSPLSQLPNFTRFSLEGDIEDLAPLSILEDLQYLSILQTSYSLSPNDVIEDLEPLSNLGTSHQ